MFFLNAQSCVCYDVTDDTCYYAVFSEFRKKMDTAKVKITTLQKKQKDTERLASITGHNDKRSALGVGQLYCHALSL